MEKNNDSALKTSCKLRIKQNGKGVEAEWARTHPNSCTGLSQYTAPFTSVRKSKVLNKTPSRCYGMLLAIWDHTVLPSTWYKWTHPHLNPSRCWYLTYLLQRDGRLSWPRWSVTYWDGLRYPPQMVTHPSTNLAVHGRELNSWKVRHPKHYTNLVMKLIAIKKPNLSTTLNKLSTAEQTFSK